MDRTRVLQSVAMLRHQRMLLAASAALALGWLLGGCATVQEVASRTPLISMAYDAMEGYKLVDSMLKDDSMSEAEVRAMMARPLPPPPGISFDVALLRRVSAAASLGEVGVVEDSYRLAVRSDVKVTMDFITELVVYANAFSGSIRRARDVSLQIERSYVDKARKAGRPAYSWAGEHLLLYSSMLAIAAGMGDRALFNRLMSDYPESLDADTRLAAHSKALYVISRKSMLYSKLKEEGDYEAALKLSEQLEQTIAQRMTSLPEQDRKKLAGSAMGARSQLAILASLLRRPDAALTQIDAMRELEKDAESPRTARATVLFAEAMHMTSLGRHKDGLEKLDESWKARLRFEKSGKVPREDHARDRARLQVAVGEYDRALETIGELGPIESVSIKYYREWFIAIKAYALASLKRTDQDLSALDSLDAEMAQRVGTEGARFHYAVKTVAHHAAFLANRSQENLRQAVLGGRQFSRSYQLMRSTGAFGDITTPPDILPRAKAAYLLSTLAAAGNFGVTNDEILDAFAIFADSETDDAVAAAALRNDVPGLSASEVRRLQDLRVETRRATRQVEIVSKTDDAAEVARAAADMERARQEYDGELNRLQRKAPVLAQLLAARSPRLAQIRGKLLATEALVAFAVTSEATAALIVTKSAFSYRTLPVTSAAVKELVTRVRKSTTIPDSGELPAFDVAAAGELYQKLIVWGAPQLRGIRQLSVVASGSLASIPFGLLLTQPATGQNYRPMQWLVKSYGITHAPSIASWVLAGTGASSGARQSSFIAWADPDFGGAANESGPAGATRAVRRSMRAPDPGPKPVRPLSAVDFGSILPALPDTRREAQAIARTVKADASSDIVMGTQATRASVLGMSANGKLAGKSIVMFATHGLAPGELKELTQPALAMAKDPASGALPLLLLDDVVGLRLNADWVLLSACNTSAADSVGGDALSGLARGFFFAGARSLLVTHWAVESESAASITVKTMEKYASGPKVTRADALQAASVDLINGKGGPAIWAHPAFWAPYVVVGDGHR